MLFLKFRYYLFLFLAFIFMVLAFFNDFKVNDKSKIFNENNYRVNLQESVQNELLLSDHELTTIVTNAQKNAQLNFESFKINTTYPYLIFENGKAIYWSTNQYSPSFDELIAAKTSKFIENSSGNFLVNSKSFIMKGKNLEVFSIIFLKRSYENQNDFLQSSFNEKLFLTNPLNITKNKAKSSQKTILSSDNKPLFYIDAPFSSTLKKPIISKNSIFSISLAFLFLGIFCFQLIKLYHFKNKIGITYLILFSYLLLVRALMLYFSIPFLFVETNVFNPKFFVHSAINPSIGDLFINLIVSLVFVFYVLSTYSKCRLFKFLIASSKITKTIFAFIFIILSYLIYLKFYEIISSFYRQPQQYFDLGLNNQFDTFRIIAILIFLVLSILFFVTNHLLINLFIRTAKNNHLWIFIITTFFGQLYLISRFGFEASSIVLSSYWIMVILTRFYKKLGNFRYRTTIYMFTAAFFCGLMSFLIHLSEVEKRNFSEKRNIGERFLAENDLLTEGLLSKTTSSVYSDSSIVYAIKNQIFAREKVKQIVVDKYLDAYLDSYDTEVLLFDESGITFDNTIDAKNLDYYIENFQKEQYQTQNKGVYFVNEPERDLNKQYIVFIPIESANRLIGQVVLDMKLEGEGSQGIYPDLLKNRKGFQDISPRDFSYATFQKEILKQNIGFFNYNKKFSKSNLELNKLYEKGINENEFSHVGLKNEKGRTIIVSSKARTFYQNIADFSFQFMILVIGVILVIIAHSFRFGFNRINLNFATKIQIYLNVAFLLPLLLIIVITLSVVSSTFSSNQGQSYLDITQNISQNIKPSLLKFNQGNISIGVLNQELNRTAKEAKVDINLFDNGGKLIASTRPLIFENNLLAKLINPKVYVKLIEEKEGEVLETERIGSLKFNSAFIGVNESTNKIAGIVSIPFFNSQSNLDSQITNVISSILSVFTLIFISLLIISYFASNSLTVPMNLITQKIKKINLDKPNEPLIWKTKDEIGLLMNEYNKMLLKLEESKEALALSEKQTAWREMAKQVAHEIKNPLTPMKLSVQQLQRTLKITEDPKTRDRIERALNSLIEQIDNISDIAQSFSDFAKMPIPRSDFFDISEVLQKCTDLYADDQRVSLNSYIRVENVYVLGDRQLLSRILTNLIINGIQSVPASRKPIINLRLYKAELEDKIIIEVQDNGSGIPESLRAKIFVPNFSTKAGGSGLGLAMAKKGIEHANGNLWFESVTGKGSVFYMDFPIAERI